MHALLGSLAAMAAGCQSPGAPAERPGDTAPLGTARAALVANNVLEVVGDTVIGEATPNLNAATDEDLSVQSEGRHRALLFFDVPALQAVVEGSTLLSARIDLFIASNGGDWGKGGRPIALHALRQQSVEAAATWSCAADSDPSNQQADCSPQTSWKMGATDQSAPFVLTPTDTAHIVDGTQGVVSFDVTADVLAILDGTLPGHGWLVKKVDETLGGAVRFTSREQGPAPRLTLIVDAPASCTPIAIDDTSCDGLDDDCDGQLDEDFAVTATSCGVGGCAATGVLSCAGGQLLDSCSPALPAPDDATCDLTDDDCDGAVDEDYAPAATSCGVGACGAEGETSCVLGSVMDSCQPGTPAALDAVCDGVDDDCDGVADEDYASLATECGVGACRASGSTSCVAGQVVDGCEPGPAAANDATCDRADDDCDGVVDEDYVPVATSCGVGACNAGGLTSCVLGSVSDSCQPRPPAALDAVCDGVDDDCDGVADEDYASLVTECGVGACRASGSTSCVAGQVVDGCEPGSAAADDTTCDGVDDDCDGPVDEDFVRACGGQSSLSCVAGELVATDCSDHDPCNGEESCSAGVCTSGPAPVLDDGDPCTIDVCTPGAGVTHAPASAGTACAPYSECDASAECVSLLPPEPSEVAPPLPVGVVSLFDRVRYLFEGEPRIQTGVAPGAISSRSVAVLRGRVLDPNGAPLPQVTVSVHGHPEYGQTLTRLDGAYDLVVNGGGPLTLRFVRGDALEAQRTTRVPWQDEASLDDVALTARDALSTHANFPTSAPVFHRGSVQTDARGSRSARLFVPSGTGASRRLTDGSVVQVTQLSLRTSELSVGAGVVSALPAELPPTAAAVYAVEVSADEADALGGAVVELSQPAWLHVDDFMQLPPGTPLPLASYDRADATWFGAPNGRVIELVGVSSGQAELDLEGSGAPATPEQLAAHGIFHEELVALAQSFSPGEAFYRLPIHELGPLSVSLPFGVDEGSGGEDPPAPGQLAPLDDPTLPAAQAETQVLALSLPLAGTPFTLQYRSSRVLGDRRGRALAIPVTGSSVSSGLLGGLVDVQITGQRHTFALPAAPGESVEFEWDGSDAAGRLLHGWQRATVRVGLLSQQRYFSPNDEPRAFGHTASGSEVLGTAAQPHVRWLHHERWLHAYDSRQTAIGGWSLDPHHHYDPRSRVVYLGDGRSYPTRTTSTTIERFAGQAQNAQVGLHSGDNGPAISARMDSPRSVTVAPDGSVFIGTRQGVRRVAAGTGVITTVAGGRDLTSCNPNLEEGSPQTMCIYARSVDIGRDGALYISDNPIASGTFDRLRRLDLTTGMIRTVAGVRPTSGCANMGDGGPARDAALCNLIAHASAPDGSIYLLDSGSASNPDAIRKISTDGTIDTIASADWGNGDDPADVAVGPDGSVYVAQTRSVLRILPTGEVRQIAGDLGASGNSGDGGPAILARFGNNGPGGVSVAADGRVYVGDTGNARVRMIDPLGIIRRVAGTAANAPAGDGGPPLLASLGSGPVRTALGPDGALFVTSRANHTLRVVRPNLPGDFTGEARVPSPDGSEIYRFSAEGRHLDTRLAASGALVYTFGYDPAGRLVSVTDGAGNTTAIERDAEGSALRIVAPLGEETLLDNDAHGYLTMLVGPTGEQVELEYDAGGLLVRQVDASGLDRTWLYDTDGRLLAP